MWLHHAPHFLHVTGSSSALQCFRVNVDVYTLSEQQQQHVQGSATLDYQKQLLIPTRYSTAPRILFFGKLGSDGDALVYPHLVVYDDTLKQLECHRVDPSGHFEVAQIGLDLGRVELCRVVSSSRILLAAALSKKHGVNGYELFEWTPSQHRLLRGHLETDHIVGIAEGPHNQPWCIFYHHPMEAHRIVISRGFPLSGHPHQDLDMLASSLPTRCISPEYLDKLQRIESLGPQFQSFCGSTMDPLCTLWAQTRSGELVCFERGILQWSTALQTPVIKIVDSNDREQYHSGGYWKYWIVFGIVSDGV
ncbi:hypothetical protein BGX31_008123 [Mortierella sp. GBA43]|nr:hypothetical protein BGX31_008123 [Mortierella sp. GBA43]